MELQTPETENKPTVPTITAPSQSPRSRKRFPLKALLVVLLVIMLAGGGATAYWMRDQEAKKQSAKQAQEIASLKAQLSEPETATEEDSEDTTASPTADSNAENIADAISSGNTAALEGYMASTVRVILAASEGVGDRTPAQAVSDLEYIEDADDPWDFDLPAATLSEYGAGGYGQYFPIGAVVGKSADDMIVSFTFDAAGDINGIFMAVNADLLN